MLGLVFPDGSVIMYVALVAVRTYMRTVKLRALVYGLPDAGTEGVVTANPCQFTPTLAM